jgi:sugar phosphate isomerase/epimerase
VRIALYLAVPGSRFWTATIPDLSLDGAMARASALGFDAVEVMPRATDDPTPDTLRRLSARHRLPVLAIASGFLAIEHGLTLTHFDAGVRRQAVDGLLRCVAVARQIGAAFVSVGLVRGRLTSGMSHPAAAAYLTAALREVGLAAAAAGVTLVLEPGNRYETDFVHTAAEGAEVLDAVGLPSVRLMLDTFHMNIEEASLVAAVRHAGPRLAHLHVADSNRRAPGWGHLDLRPVLETLAGMDYRGAIGLEILLAPDAEAAARQGLRTLRALLQETGLS